MLLIAITALACRSKDYTDTGSPAVDDSSVEAVDNDGDGSPVGEDCDDDDSSAWPGNSEVCDGVDNDCNGEVDDGVGEDWAVDGDGDGYGGDETVQACDQPEGTATETGDCDDGDSRSYPGADERCDGVDNDCDGETDEEVTSIWYADADGDGFGDAAEVLDDCDPPSGYVGNDADCDDGDGEVFPGNVEVCNDVDDNCDGQIDEGLLETFYEDADGDGFGTSSTVEACEQPSGYAAESDDCDDGDAAVNPDAEELCNGVDDDCDGEVDPDDSRDASTWWVDADGDGYGSSSYSTTGCEQPSGWVDNEEDCDDLDADISPDADEVCDTVDNDCDGDTDEESATDASTWYADSDRDGYGDASSTHDACDQPSGYTDDDSDCDDTDSSVHPGAAETGGDGTDSNCDGIDGCNDLDCDSAPDVLLPRYYTSTYGYAVDSTWYDASLTGTDIDTSGVLKTHAEDLDQDGFIDLVMPCYYGSSSGYACDTTVWWGSASGYSSSDTTDLGAGGVWRMLAEDVDGDGYTDLVLGEHYSSSGYGNEAWIYYGSSTGYDASDLDELTTSSVSSITSGDFDGDGNVDLFFCSYYGTSYVFYGPSWSSSDTVSSSYCYDVQAADLNGDGYDDVATARAYGYAQVYWGTSSGISSSYVDTLGSYYARSLDIGDLDADGYEDVVVGGYSGSTYVWWNSSVGFSTSVYSDLTATGCFDVQAEDLDSDGYEEVICAVYYDGAYSTDSVVFWGSASGPDDSDTTELPTVGSTGVTAGDLDGDGYPELVFTSYYDGGSYAGDSYVYWGSASGYDSSDADTLSGGGVWGRAVLVGDTSW